MPVSGIWLNSLAENGLSHLSFPSFTPWTFSVSNGPWSSNYVFLKHSQNGDSLCMSGITTVKQERDVLTKCFFCVDVLFSGFYFKIRQSDNTLKCILMYQRWQRKQLFFRTWSFFLFFPNQVFFYLLLLQHKPTEQFYCVTKPGSVLRNQEVKYTKCTKSWHPEIEMKIQVGFTSCNFFHFFSDAFFFWYSLTAFLPSWYQKALFVFLSY